MASFPPEGTEVHSRWPASLRKGLRWPVRGVGAGTPGSEPRPSPCGSPGNVWWMKRLFPRSLSSSTAGLTGAEAWSLVPAHVPLLTRCPGWTAPLTLSLDTQWCLHLTADQVTFGEARESQVQTKPGVGGSHPAALGPAWPGRRGGAGAGGTVPTALQGGAASPLTFQAHLPDSSETAQTLGSSLCPLLPGSPARPLVWASPS